MNKKKELYKLLLSHIDPEYDLCDICNHKKTDTGKCYIGCYDNYSFKPIPIIEKIINDINKI